MAFHPYPQLIRALFNVNRCGPPGPVTAPSAWPRVDHRVSRLPQATLSPYSDSLSLRIRASSAYPRRSGATRRLIMQKARRRPLKGSDRSLTDGFRFYFTPLPGCFPPFPHGTGPLSVFREYLALRVGPRCFGQDSSCPALLRYCTLQAPVARTGVSPSSPGISMPFRFPKPVLSAQPYYPACASTHTVWAPAFSLAATRAIDLFFLLLRVLGCFGSPRSPRLIAGGRPPAGRVAPFGHARI